MTLLKLAIAGFISKSLRFYHLFRGRILLFLEALVILAVNLGVELEFQAQFRD